MVCQTPSQIKVLLDICFNSYTVSNSLSDQDYYDSVSTMYTHDQQGLPLFGVDMSINHLLFCISFYPMARLVTLERSLLRICNSV